MQKKASTKKEKRIVRHSRIRARVSGTADKPRLALFKSNRAVSVQLIDDEKGMTIASATSMKDSKGTLSEKGRAVGMTIAKTAAGKNITHAVFDRGGFLYTGVVKAVADGAREGGLNL
jgi:large subunit ribosomal protein L18